MKSGFANCVGFIWVFFIAMDSKTRLVLFFYIRKRLNFVNFSRILKFSRFLVFELFRVFYFLLARM